MKRLITLILLACSLCLQAQVKMMKGANDPIGTPKGIHAGRVAWAHAPGAARWPGEGSGNWYDDQWNDQEAADWLVSNALTSLTGEKNAPDAWVALFTHFNTTHQRSGGYQAGQRIAIKANMNNTYNYEESGEINASPHMALALLRSLVNDAQVPQECITIFDASRYLTNGVYLKCHAEFPKVNYVDNVGEEGRKKTEYKADAIHYSRESGNMCTGLSTVCTEADYIINMALLKGHVGQGVTLCGKNWYGVTDINKDWRKNAHVNMNQDKQGRPRYITFVDYMGHQDIGGKTILYLIDGLYGCKFVDGLPRPKWQMQPFNGDWPCSLLASQDPVAIDAVALDLLVSEFPDAPDMDYADAYLVEAALADNAPSGTKYDPEGDGTTLQSLGVMEHWNNPEEKKYKKIDLVYRVRPRVVVGYVTSWGDRMPDPALVTHYNYAFGHVTDTFDSVRIDNPERLRSIVALKDINPDLKVMVSVGGWGSGLFSEMAASEQTRKSFAANCMKAIGEYGLDGIDIDWEYPTSSSAGISSSPEDKENFTLLMRDLREAIGPDYLLTFADYADTTFVNYREVMPYVDFVNLMTYDIADPPYHHSALYRSDITGVLSVSEAVDHHVEAGVSLSQLVMGMPFYGRGSKDYKGQRPFGKLDFEGIYEERWDTTSLVPYLVDPEGRMVLAYENARSIAHKCEYILTKGLRGAMYWDSDSDDDTFTLSRTIWNHLNE